MLSLARRNGPKQDKQKAAGALNLGHPAMRDQFMRHSNRWPDRPSEWILPPPAAWVAGDAVPVRVFDTAEAALAFLALLGKILQKQVSGVRGRLGG
jgi:hypothetical protein